MLFDEIVSTTWPWWAALVGTYLSVLIALEILERILT